MLGVHSHPSSQSHPHKQDWVQSCRPLHLQLAMYAFTFYQQSLKQDEVQGCNSLRLAALKQVIVKPAPDWLCEAYEKCRLVYVAAWQ